MVLGVRNMDIDDSMPQTVPSAGFTPPCDYSAFVCDFDVSLLTGEEPLSPSTTSLYGQPPTPPNQQKIKIYTTFYPTSPPQAEEDLGPDLQKLLVPDTISNEPNKTTFPASLTCGIYLDVPKATSPKNYHANSPIGALSPYSHGLLSPSDQQFSNFASPEPTQNFYPNSPSDNSVYSSPNSIYSRSPREDLHQNQYIKQENPFVSPPSPIFSSYLNEDYSSACPNSPNGSIYSNLSSPENISTRIDTIQSPRRLDNSPRLDTISSRLETSSVDNSSIRAHLNNPTIRSHLENSTIRAISSQIDNTDVFKILTSTVLDKQIKQESTVDFGNLLSFQETSLRDLLESPPKKIKTEDHHLLRECLRDTSYQKKYNLRPFDIPLLEENSSIKMEEPDENVLSQAGPVFKIYMEQMKKDISTTCEKLNISPDPSQWTSKDVSSWIEWTSREFGFPDTNPEQWDMNGSSLVVLTEEDFTSRSPQGGVKLYAQLELWKAALESELNVQWLPETTSSNASSGDISDDDDEDATSHSDTPKPTTSTSRSGGSHIHLWQFLKELLAQPQAHGSCIRWLDRSKGVFKIEDSVKVAKLWGKRKNRPAMNYDKLSRSIRQYYKKGIMKKTERSQRLVYQFCHPYSL